MNEWEDDRSYSDEGDKAVDPMETEIFKKIIYLGVIEFNIIT